MRFITIIVLVLAYGPAIFHLAVTGRGVHRPSKTSTTDWALAHFYTSHVGKPSLAIPPTGLAGAVITSDHNNQDSNVVPTVSIWTTVHVTSRRALANVGSFVNSFNHPRLDRQWRYIRGCWQFYSGRVIDEGLTVCIDFLLFLAVILTIWRKRATEELARFVGRQLLGAPTTCTGVVTVFEELRPAQEQVPGAPTASSEIVSVAEAHGSSPTRPNSRRIIVDTLLVFPGGFVVIHYEAVDGRAFWTITVILNPVPSSSSAVSRRTDKIYRVVSKRTVTLPTRGLIQAGPPVVRRGGESLPSHEPVARPNVSPKRRPGSTSSFFTTIQSLEGVLVMACSSTGNGLHWSIQFHPFQHYHISHHANNDHEKEELVQADVDIPIPDSPELHGLDRSTRSLDLYDYIAALFNQFLSHRAMLVRPLIPEEARAIRTELRPRLRSLGERARECRGQEELTQGTASGIEPEAHVVLAPSVDSDDGNGGDEAEEEETEGNDLVEPALVPLPPSRPASPEAEELDNLAEEELLRSDLLPHADSRPSSPEPQALDRSTRRSDLYQYIAALSRQYLYLRAMLVRPLLPGEARAIRAELRPRLGSLEERACERRGLPTFTLVATEPVNEQEIVEQVHEEEVVGHVHEVDVDGQAHEEEVDGQLHEEEADEQANDEEVDGQLHEEEADEQADDEEVDGRFNDQAADVSRKRKKPRRGGKKTRTRKHKHQTDKEEEADPSREH